MEKHSHTFLLDVMEFFILCLVILDVAAAQTSFKTSTVPIAQQSKISAATGSTGTTANVAVVSQTGVFLGSATVDKRPLTTQSSVASSKMSANSNVASGIQTSNAGGIGPLSSTSLNTISSTAGNSGPAAITPTGLLLTSNVQSVISSSSVPFGTPKVSTSQLGGTQTGLTPLSSAGTIYISPGQQSVTKTSASVGLSAAAIHSSVAQGTVGTAKVSLSQTAVTKTVTSAGLSAATMPFTAVRGIIPSSSVLPNGTFKLSPSQPAMIPTVSSVMGQNIPMPSSSVGVPKFSSGQSLVSQAGYSSATTTSMIPSASNSSRSSAAISAGITVTGNTQGSTTSSTLPLNTMTSLRTNTSQRAASKAGSSTLGAGSQNMQSSTLSSSSLRSFPVSTGQAVVSKTGPSSASNAQGSTSASNVSVKSPSSSSLAISQATVSQASSSTSTASQGTFSLTVSNSSQSAVPPAVFTQASIAPSTTLSSNGSIIPKIRTIDRYYTNGTSVWGDGSIIAGTVQADGSVLYPGEIKVTPDGKADYGRRTAEVSKILDGGLKLLPDKSILYPNDTLLTADGRLIIPTKAEYKPNMPKVTGVATLYSNGTGVLPNGTIIKGEKQPDGAYFYPQYEINVKKNGSANYLGVASSEGVKLSDGTKKFFDNSFLFPNNSYLLPNGMLITAKHANATFELPAVKGIIQLYSNGTMIDQHNRVKQLKRTPHGNYAFPDEEIEVTPKGVVIYDGVRAKGAKPIDGAPPGYMMFNDDSILLPNKSLLLDDGILIVAKYAPSTTPLFVAKHFQYLYGNGTGVKSDGSVIRGEAQADGSFLFPNDVKVQADGQVVYGGLRSSSGKVIEQGYTLYPDNSVLFPNKSLLMPDGTLIIAIGVSDVPAVKGVQYLFTNGSGVSPNGQIIHGIPGPNGVYLFPGDITVLANGSATYSGIRASGGKVVPDKGYTLFTDKSILFRNNSLLLPNGTMVVLMPMGQKPVMPHVLPPCHSPHCKDEIYTGEKLGAELFICSCGVNEQCSPSATQPVQFHYSPQLGNQSGKRVAFVCTASQPSLQPMVIQARRMMQRPQLEVTTEPLANFSKSPQLMWSLPMGPQPQIASQPMGQVQTQASPQPLVTLSGSQPRMLVPQGQTDLSRVQLPKPQLVMPMPELAMFNLGQQQSQVNMPLWQNPQTMPEAQSHVPRPVAMLPLMPNPRFQVVPVPQQSSMAMQPGVNMGQWNQGPQVLVPQRTLSRVQVRVYDTLRPQHDSPIKFSYNGQPLVNSYSMPRMG